MPESPAVALTFNYEGTTPVAEIAGYFRDRRTGAPMAVAVLGNGDVVDIPTRSLHLVAADHPLLPCVAPAYFAA